MSDKNPIVYRRREFLIEGDDYWVSAMIEGGEDPATEFRIGDGYNSVNLFRYRFLDWEPDETLALMRGLHQIFSEYLTALEQAIAAQGATTVTSGPPTISLE